MQASIKRTAVRDKKKTGMDIWKKALSKPGSMRESYIDFALNCRKNVRVMRLFNLNQGEKPVTVFNTQLL
ncbi:hypothetical protein GSUB_08460 [Geoalkalibacter subterraneus]|uniref:Uncharacterized protein n=1 Tax=Geoalkalibacter subterraneus TaxID=483547 RepID=A0A0B5FGW4_9BACT|nr:hypothetical protein GSUB_08460 [Geoalkalibacter subterraneus]